MIIPHARLSREALAGVIEEYVTRDGTELSDAVDKAAEVRRRLDSGELLLVFDPDTESCNLLTPEQVVEAENAPPPEPDPFPPFRPDAEDDGFSQERVVKDRSANGGGDDPFPESFDPDFEDD